MGFEPVAVEELLRQFKVDEDDLARIRAFGVLQKVSVEALIHDFYDWLEHEPWFSSFFSGGVPPRVKSLQSSYWVDFLKGIVDSDYVERRIVVGKVHAVINLPVSAYLAGMNFCQDWLANRAREVVSDADQCFQLLQSLSRLAQLDTNIVMHVYASQSMETIREQGELTRKIVAEVSRVVSAAANGDFTLAYNRQSGDDTLEEPLNLMVSNLKRFNQQSEQEKWIKTGIADLAGVIRGGLTLSEVATNSLTFLARYLRALVGVIYVAQDPKVVVRASSYACVFEPDDNPSINAGDGLVGQVLIDHEPKHISDLPGDYLQVSSGLGSRSPRHIYLQPLIYERQVKGIMELGFFDALDSTQLALLEQISEPVAVSINSALDRDKMEHLLKVSQQTSLELEAQQDELKGANEALEAQAQALKQSEEALTAQKDLLEHSNLELQQKTQDLETQKMEIEAAREELQLKAEQLYLTSQYKSEFLAN
ncbi:MAG: protoglobin domain-containing protein, partial [Pseudomonadales bacterium]|nr:protoglobin domain-containing protein [Pseudomonadales bacterium]